ncbi:MAG: zinc ribbon domain-containing protein [Chloroflexi bacterium]|nr:zinc ribbon domain-containing protein [Chloroflexota bacterium]MDA1282968.1 zinc ribbon domain-containing protein [Chloroflexota bacterium]
MLVSETTNAPRNPHGTTGSGISRLFNLQNQKYQTVSCTKCGFTELYRLDGSGFGNVLDLFVG